MDTIEVEISDTQGHLRTDPSELINLARHVLMREGRRNASISIALVDEASIHSLNRLHLQHDWPTDVISFTLSNPDDNALAGELVVSAEMAVATAVEDGVAPRDELALYVVHGLLHLCGYDDSAESDAAVMRQREDEILTELGYANPWGVECGQSGLGGERILKEVLAMAKTSELGSGGNGGDRPDQGISFNSPLTTLHSPLPKESEACQ